MNVQSLTFLVFLTGTVCLCRMAGRWGRQWQITLLLAGAAMLCFGVWRGEAAAVLNKAIKLCLECVGIG